MWDTHNTHTFVHTLKRVSVQPKPDTFVDIGNALSTPCSE